MLGLKTFTFNPLQENTYLLYNDQSECCIIDPGCYFPQEREQLRQSIETAGLKPVLLLNTHCHLDHIFGNKYVFDTWGLIPHIHRNEEQVLDNAPQSARIWNLPFEHYEGEKAWFEAGDDISLGADRLHVLFTPGHSPGSVSFYHAAGNFVISGDALFHESIGRTDLPGGNFDVLISAIKSELFSLPDDTVVYPGHGPDTTIGHEKKFNPFLRQYLGRP